MNIVLCDDDIIFLNSLEQKIAHYNCTIYKFSSAQEILASQMKFDIAFLDIELGNNTTGFSLVKHIRSINNQCVISFFTNYKDYAVDGYEYQPFRYILKNSPETIINKRINDTFIEFYRKNKLIKGYFKDKKFAVALSDIYYVETFNHVLTLHTKKGNFEMYKLISEICDELSIYGFFRCHRSYIVNIYYISSIKNDNSFVLSEPLGEIIPIGIRYKAAAKQMYLEQTTIIR